MRFLSLCPLVLFSGAIALSAIACSSSSPGEGVQDAGGTPDVGVIHITPKPDAGKSMDSGHPTDVDVEDAADEADSLNPTDAELNTYPGFTPPMPQVVSFNGPVVSNPIFIPVLFAGDPYAQQIIDYVSVIGGSQYWAAVGTEYGVGPATMATPIVLDEGFTSSIDDSQLQVWLANEIGTNPAFLGLPGTVLDAGGYDAGAFDASTNDAGIFEASAPLFDAASPAVRLDANYIYVLFLPHGTSITLEGGASCRDFGGYHNSFSYSPNGANVVYGVVPRCGSFGPLSGFDAISGPTSHELIEAATDPLVGSFNESEAAYADVDSKHAFWSLILGGGEVGDMCAQFPQSFYHPSEAALSPYVVQRIWSNKAALAGNDPCVPALPADVQPYYFNAAPNLTLVEAIYEGQSFEVYGISAPLDTPTPLEIDTFSNKTSNGQTWEVQVYDGLEFIGQSASPALTFAPTSFAGLNGDRNVVSVNNMGGGGQSTHPFVVVSSLGQELQNWWIGVVVD